MIKKVIIGSSTVIFIVVSLWLLQRLLMPKYMTDVQEGALIAEYYQEDKNHDVIFVGDCEVYENFSPYILWNEFGIPSYIRGSAQQLIWQSYYLLEDTLRYETPKVVIFNVLAMKYNEPQKEAYNRMTLEGMKWSMSKVKAIQASMTKEESIFDYLFPILRYHSRISELTSEDVTYLFHRKGISYNGYYMQTDVKPAGYVPEGKLLSDYTFGDVAYEYLDRITKLCKQKGVRLVLVKAPSLYPYWYPEWENQIEEYAEQNDLLYVNFLERKEQIGLDFTKDTYDAGLHLNVSGAEKLTRYLGRILAEDCGLKSRKSEKKLSELWDHKSQEYKKGKDKNCL